MAMGFRHIIKPSQTWNKGTDNGVGNEEVKRAKITARKSTNSSLNRKIATKKQILAQHQTRSDVDVPSKGPKGVQTKEPKSSIATIPAKSAVESVRSKTLKVMRPDEQSSVRVMRWVPNVAVESPRSEMPKTTLREQQANSAKVVPNTTKSVELSRSDVSKFTRKEQSSSAEIVYTTGKMIELSRSARSDVTRDIRREQPSLSKVSPTVSKMVESPRLNVSRLTRRENCSSTKNLSTNGKTVESSRSNGIRGSLRDLLVSANLVPRVEKIIESCRLDTPKVTRREQTSSTKIVPTVKTTKSSGSDKPEVSRRQQANSAKVVLTAITTSESDMLKVALRGQTCSSKIVPTVEKAVKLSRSEKPKGTQPEVSGSANIVPSLRTTVESARFKICTAIKSASERAYYRGDMGQTFSRPRMNGQFRAGTRVLRSLKPKRALMLERLGSSPPPIDDNEIASYKMLPLSKEVQQRNLINIRAKFDDSSPILSSLDRPSKLPKVKRNMDEVLQTIPANMANLRSIPLVVLDCLKPESEPTKGPRLRCESTVKSTKDRENRTSNLKQDVSLKWEKRAPNVRDCDKEETKLKSTSFSLNSPVKDNELIFKIKEEPITPPPQPQSVTSCKEEPFVEDSSKSGDWNNNVALSRIIISPKRTGRNDSHFFGKYAYMVGKRVVDPARKHRHYVTRRLSKRGRPFGSRPRSRPFRTKVSRSWRSRQQKRIRLSCPDVDIIDGMEFLSFESDEDLKIFIRNNPGRICKGPSRIDLDLLRPCSASGQPIIPTKTNDITKIKGWRNKLFDPEAISTLDHILKNQRRLQVRNVAYKKELIGLPSCSSFTSTSIGFNNNYFDEYDDYTFYDENEKYDLNWMRDYGGGDNNETSVFESIKVERDDDDVINNDAESIKSVDLGIMSSECIDEELRRRDQKEDNARIKSRALLHDSFSNEDVSNKSVSNPSVKSAFVSDFLDDFLKNQSELKVKLPEPVYVSPDDIDTKVCWPSHEMAVLDQVPAIPEIPLNVLQPTFRQRRVIRPLNSNGCRLRGRGRPPRKPFYKSQIGSLPSSRKQLTKTSSEKLYRQREPVQMVKITLRHAVFAAKALDKRFRLNKKAITLATGTEINHAMNKHSARASKYDKTLMKKCLEYSVIVSPIQAEIAASAVVPKKVSNGNLNAWERFLRTTSTDANGPRVSSPDTGFHEETSSFCDTTVSDVISVADSSRPAGVCYKDFCRMGCLCDSLKVRKRRRGHCGKVQCMFSCSCNPFDERKLTSKKNKTDGEEEIHLPKRRRQIRIPARLKDSVYFYGGDGVEKDIKKNSQSTKEEKYNKYKMKSNQNKSHNKIATKPQVKLVEEPRKPPLQQLKPKASSKDYISTFSKLSAAELRAYSKLGYPKDIKSSVSSKVGGAVTASNSAVGNRLQEPPSTVPVSSPVKSLRLEFKNMAPIVRPASSRSIPTILRRSGSQTARKSLNPSAQYQGAVPSYSGQAQTETVDFRRFFESKEKTNVVVSNLVHEMVRKVSFRDEVSDTLQNQSSQCARVPVVASASGTPVVTSANGATSSSTVNVRFPVSLSRMNIERRQVEDSGNAMSSSSSCSRPSTEMVKVSKDERQQNRRKQLRLAFTHLAMVACPVVKDMWSQRNSSFSITAFVFRMACTAIGRLRQQEKKLVLSKQSLIRERMELFNKYTEYLKGVDLVQQKQTIKELANRLQRCCRERNQRNKDNDEQQKHFDSAVFTGASMQNVTKKPKETQRPLNWIPISVLPCSRIRSHSRDDVDVMDVDSPSSSSSNSNVSIGDPIGKVGNKPILLGDSVMIGGSYTASLRPTHSTNNFQDGCSIKTVRLNSQKGGMKWISLQGNSSDSNERDILKESNVSVTDLVRKPPTVTESKNSVAELFKKPSTLNESSVVKMQPVVKDSNNAVTVKSGNHIKALCQQLRAAKNASDYSIVSVDQTSMAKKVNDSVVAVLKKLPTNKKTNDSMVALMNKLSATKNTKDSVVVSAEKPSVTMRANDSVAIPIEKPSTTNKKNDSVAAVVEKLPTTTKTNNSVAIFVDDPTKSRFDTEDSVSELIVQPVVIDKSKDSEAGSAKNSSTVAVKFAKSDTITYLPTKSSDGSYLTVAELLKIAQREPKDSITVTTACSNLNAVSSLPTTTGSAVVSSLQPETALNQMTLMKSASNGCLVAVRPDKDTPPLLIGVVPTTSASSNGTLSVAAATGSNSAITTMTNRRKTSSNLVARDMNRFVVIKPKPYPMLIEQIRPLPVPLLSPREQLVVSPVDETPLNIEDIPKRKRKSVAILLRQQKDAARAAARAATAATNAETSSSSCQSQPIIVPLQTTYPQEALLGPMNTFLANPIQVPTVSIGVDDDDDDGGGEEGGGLSTTEMPKMLFSPITEDDFLHGEDVS